MLSRCESLRRDAIVFSRGHQDLKATAFAKYRPQGDRVAEKACDAIDDGEAETKACLLYTSDAADECPAV